LAGLDESTPVPTEIKLHQKSRVVEITFADGKRFELPYELLRVFSPSAEMAGHGPGQEVLQVGKKDIDITQIDPVGSYAVPPIQLCIRLLVPAGSYLLQLPEFRRMLAPFDANLLGYPWRHADPRVDALQQALQALAAQGEQERWARSEIFERIWRSAHGALDLPPPPLDRADLGEPIAHLSEPWYCCAEPTDQQLQSF